MRVAIFIKNTTFHAGYGGLETQNKLLAEGLAKNGHTVVVYAPQKELSQAETTLNKVTYKFVPCVFQKFSSLVAPSPESWLKKSYTVFRADHSQTPFNLVLSQSSAGLGVILQKRELGVPVISISHGSKLGEYKTRVSSISSPKDVLLLALDVPHVLRAFFKTQRQFIHGSNKVIAVSAAVKQAIINETYAPADKITVIHNGIDPTPFSKVKKDPGYAKAAHDTFNLLYVGRVERAKGLFVLIDVLLEFKGEQIKLTIVGTGADFTAIQSHINKLHLQQTVTLAGAVSYDQIPHKMGTADVFVLPTLRVEGFPMTLVEAMFSGLPIIASDLGGNSDAVNENTGILVKPGDKPELKQAILKLKNNPELREQMGSNALKTAKSNFTLDGMIDKYEKVMSDVIKEMQK